MRSLLCAVIVAAPLTAALAEPLPDVATLAPSANFAAFVRSDVPLDIHRQAMRRLWATLDPALVGPDTLDLHALEGAGVRRAAQPAAAPETAKSGSALVLPAAASLTRESDFTPFLAKDVPLGVHRAAMRRLWATHPEFAIYDGDPMHSVASTDSVQPKRQASVALPSRIVAID